MKLWGFIKSNRGKLAILSAACLLALLLFVPGSPVSVRAIRRGGAPNADGGLTASRLLSATVRMAGDAKAPVMLIGGLQVEFDPLQTHAGAFREFDGAGGVPTPWKDYLNPNYTAFFRTNHEHRSFFYMICANRENLFHFILGGQPSDECLLAAVVGGWYKVNCAERISELALSGLNEHLPRIAKAGIDVSKNIVALKSDGWTLPLFSKTDAYIPRCAVFAVSDDKGNETIARADFGDENEMNMLYDRLATGGRVTVIVPPDSPLHRQYGVPEDKIDRLMRLRITRRGKNVELVSMRLPGEGYIAKAGAGRYAYCEEGAKKALFRLIGAAPAADFGGGRCYAIILDNRSRGAAAWSFTESETAADLMLNRRRDETTLLICGRNSEFLRKYYPHLAEHNVLFSITPSAVRHALQYSNGNFRIPDAAEPPDPQGEVRVCLADGIAIVCWGNASFALPQADLEARFASGQELAVKLPLHDPANIAFFYVTNPSWLKDIRKDLCADFLIVGNEKSGFPELLKHKRKGKFFAAVSRGSGWKIFWNDRADFRIGRGAPLESK